jgi:putative FmdB family regulatory protein
VPIYEYACQKCGHEFDALQKVSDSPLRKCPECGALRLKRLVSAPQFRLKGTGWYETDFKTDKDRKKRLADATEARPAADGAAADKDAGPSKAETTGKPEKAEKADKAAAADKPAKAGPARKKRGSGGRAAAAD